MAVAEQVLGIMGSMALHVEPSAQRNAERAIVPGPEQMLLQSIRAGNQQALASLYDTHSRLVYAVALRILRDPSKAEDVLQDVFLKVWRKPDNFIDNRGNLAPLLAITARNRAIDVLRSRRQDESCEDMVLASPENLSQSAETSLMMEKVKRIIHLLPKEQRKALDMAFFRGMTHAEIVSVTGLPLGTVKTRIRTALLFLGKSMKAPGAIVQQPKARVHCTMA